MSRDTRRARVLLSSWFSLRLWRRQLAFWAGGLALGVVAVGLAQAADYAQEGFSWILQRWWWAPFLLTPLGLAAAAWLTVGWFQGSQGSGIPQVIVARHFPTGHKARARQVSPRILVGKAILTVFGLFCGASIGREGPTVQIGAAIMQMAGRVAGIERQAGLLLAGGAAGVAAAFNTPIAGVMFAIEELSRSFEQKASGLVVSATILAGLASLALVGDYTYFGRSMAQLSGSYDILAVALCGVGGGLIGGLFSRMTIWGITALPSWRAGLVGRHPVLFAGACGLGVAILGFATDGHVYGTGYIEARNLLEDNEQLSWFYGPMKLLATVLSSISGIPGGLFAPSLSAGAGIGSAIAPMMPMVPATTVILLGMVGYFSGVVQSPITAFVIVMEMTNDHQMMIPLMATSVLGYGASRIVCHRPIYHAIALTMIRREHDEERAEMHEHGVRVQKA